MSKKKTDLFVPNIGPHPPTAHVWDTALEKTGFFFTIFGALKHHEMARYDLPTYVLHVLGHDRFHVIVILFSLSI